MTEQTKDPIQLAIDALEKQIVQHRKLRREYKYIFDTDEIEDASKAIETLRSLKSQPAAAHENVSYEGLLRDCRVLEEQRDKYLNFIIRESRGCDLESHLDEMEQYTGRRERIVPQSRQPLPHSTEGTDLHRSNMEKTENGFRVCSGLHDKNAPCEWVYYELKVEQPLPADKQAALDEIKSLLNSAVLAMGKTAEDGLHIMRAEVFIAKAMDVLDHNISAPPPVADLEGLRELKREIYNAVFKEGESRILNGIDFANLCLTIDHLHATGRLNTAQQAEEIKALKAAVRDLMEIIEGVKGAMEHGSWRDEKGKRLKDTPEWTRLYVQYAATIEAAKEG